MAWYQRFEYAIGHWLQKATEHMVGCVLCSPGCFSLFRGRALMEDNIMAKYTTLSTEARHYVQYDQGRYSPSILQSLASALSFGVTRGHDPKQLPWGTFAIISRGVMTHPLGMLGSESAWLDP